MTPHPETAPGAPIPFRPREGGAQSAYIRASLRASNAQGDFVKAVEAMRAAPGGGSRLAMDMAYRHLRDTLAAIIGAAAALAEEVTRGGGQ